MQATRCPACGETRWQLTALSLERSSVCAACGESVVPERRLPGRRPATTTTPAGERRGGASTTTPVGVG